LALGFAAVAACTLLNPLDAYGPPKPGAPEAGTDAPEGAPDGCALARWPGPPAKDDGTSKTSLVFAATSFAPGTAPGGTLGFDLDGVCTCPGPPTCVPLASQPASGSTECDGDGGVDSNGSVVLDKFLTLTGHTESVSASVQAGRGGFLVSVADYNGTDNDTAVTVSVFASNGTQPATPGGDSPIPKHDGTDVWTIDSHSLYGGTGPPFISTSSDVGAYVTGGVLVARMDLNLVLADLSFDLRAAVITGKITHTGSLWHLENGILVGRWPTAELLTSFDTVKDPFSPGGNGGLCGSSSLYQNIKGQICSSLDLVKDPALDSKQRPCDALALTLLFGAESAVMGTIMDNKPVTHLCGDGYSDDCGR
jgi:hypothetical protein